jgi:hypothetical protein
LPVLTCYLLLAGALDLPKEPLTCRRATGLVVSCTATASSAQPVLLLIPTVNWNCDIIIDLHPSLHYMVSSMGSSEQKQRPHRPPPIRVPGSNQARQVVPGPNAFAIAARAKQEKSSEVNHSTATPATTPLEESHFPQSESQGRKNGSSRGGSAMTTFTSIMEAARGSSPRKSDGHSSVVSRQGSTTRSRHSNRSQKSGTSSQPAHSKIAEEDETTTRGHIESQAEKKFFKMMGQLPGTPPAGMCPKCTNTVILLMLFRCKQLSSPCCASRPLH